MIEKSAIQLPNGKIYAGKRHCDCFKSAKEAGEKKDGGRIIQGFITTGGLFVNRELAAKIAINEGQIKELKYHQSELFSEDLY